MATTAGAQRGRNKARDARLEAARERRIKLDPDRIARDRRIDDAVVDVEIEWERRAAAEQAGAVAERAAGEAIARLTREGLTVKDVAGLTALEQSTVRRLRNLVSSTEA